ncbi:iron(III) transport system substrate-binding protein [Arcanobacterium pluranimalium]|uniref:extracellular solute-binding protein n=1 Tax=Arcanobacterium pluranimalium TaxID=108028 RepID=UPI00195A1A52|nr:extracellular solute-binding protein [Arcanobacterium pluranimalium]MBM7825013.1 iron(III) transport system substrate-binding protein [Arcanobacterium pluranimalium]
MVKSRWLLSMIPRFAIAAVVLVFFLVLGIVARPAASDLKVMCSNNLDSCEALAQSFEKRTHKKVSIVRLPTSEALAHVKNVRYRNDYDVWFGGPTEAYVIADEAGLLDVSRVQGLNQTWVGIYGGILAFCVADTVDAPHSWEELVRTENISLAAPNPATSGTAGTMLWVQYLRIHSTYEMNRFLEQLDQKVSTYTDSGIAPAKLVARNKVDVGITFAPYCERERARGAKVTTIYPRDGTSYEIGGISKLRNAPNPALAEKFVQYAASDEGQEISARSALQNPISPNLPNNLKNALDNMNAPVYTDRITTSAHLREHLISNWIRQVRNGQY